MDDPALETDPNENLRGALNRIGELWREILPLLAIVETILQIPDEERYVGREWLPAASDET